MEKRFFKNFSLFTLILAASILIGIAMFRLLFVFGTNVLLVYAIIFSVLFLLKSRQINLDPNWFERPVAEQVVFFIPIVVFGVAIVSMICCIKIF